MKRLSLSNNALSGTLPDGWLAGWEWLSCLRLDNNRLTGAAHAGWLALGSVCAHTKSDELRAANLSMGPGHFCQLDPYEA